MQHPSCDLLQMYSCGLTALGLVAFGLSLCGCGAGIGLVARNVLGNKDKDSATIVAAQEQALTATHGGAANAPIAWLDKKTGVGGILQRTGSANGCGIYGQTLTIKNEVVRGTLVACPDADGTWHLRDRTPPG